MRFLLPLILITLPWTLCAGDYRQAQTMPQADRSLVTAIAQSGDTIYAVGQRGHYFDNSSGSFVQHPFPVDRMMTGLTVVDEKMWAVGHDGLIAHKPSPNDPWQVQHDDLEAATPLFAIDFQDATTGMAVGAYGLALITHDGGNSWTQLSLSEDEPHLYQIKRDEEGSWYIPGEFGTLLKVSNKGELLKTFDLKTDATLFGVEVLGPDSLIVYGLRGRALKVDGDEIGELTVDCTPSLFGSLQHKGVVYLLGDGGIIVTVKGTTTRCHDLGERIEILGAVIDGDELVVASTHGFRRIPLSEVSHD